MKRNYLVLATLAALMSAPAFAAEHEGWVYNGLTGVGYIDENDIEDNAFSSSSSIGYRWGVFGIEGGYTMFGEFEDSFDVGASSVKLDADVGGWTLGLNVNGDLDDSWSVQGRAGAFGWNADGHVASGNTRVSFDEDGTDWYAGISINYNWSWNEKWSKKASVGLGYTYYKVGGDDSDTSIGLFGLSSEFRF